ncbi:hypothetical protein F4775DRAFT_587740 [Biscogniauxia sp. FL1348]|nr:hypothetical protein F4775DRAFT_587740 [Biscogniauxia sp. FL1348]
MTRRRIPRWRISNPMSLMALASTASALSLESFQIITSNQIPSSCIRAYSTDIDNCARKDFTNGNQCSSVCVQGLQDAASRVIAACGALNVDSKSLLGLTLSGDLIDTLCPGFEATTVTLTVRPSTTSAQGFTTPTPVLVTTSSTESTSEASTTLQTTTSIAQETSPLSVTSATTEFLTKSTTTAQTTTTTDTSAETTAQPVDTSTATQPTTSDDEPNQGQVPGSGGGSPFDSVLALGSGTNLQLTGWHISFSLAMLLIPAM